MGIGGLALAVPLTDPSRLAGHDYIRRRGFDAVR